jgi:hypothetical protein
MGFRFQYFVIDASEPVLWVAIGATSVVAIVVGQAIGHRAAAKGGRRGIALASVALVVVAAVLIAGEVTLLYVLFAVQTGGEACLPLVRHLLFLPGGAAALAATLAWRANRNVVNA